MIWQLMKRDWAWCMAPWAAVLCAVFSRGNWPYYALLFFPILISAYPGFISNCDLYEAALPIEAHALWLSRIASRLALLWLPVLAATAALAIRGERAPYLLAGAAVWTVVFLAVKRFRIHEFSAPQWVRFAIVVPFIALGPFGTLPPVGTTLAICGLASAALFLSGWFAVPATFQSAPLSPRGRVSREAHGRSRFVWSPVFRSIYGWQMWLTLFLLLSQLAIGSLFGAYFFLLALPKLMQDPRRWLSPLPVASRTLFRLTIAPLAAAIVIANVIYIFVANPQHALPVRTRIVELAAELALLCLLLWLSALMDWRGLSKFRRSVRAVPIAAGMAILLIATVVGSKSHDRAWMFDKIPAALPQNGWLLALTLIAPLAAVYWLAEKTYAEMEYPTGLAAATEPLQ